MTKRGNRYGFEGPRTLHAVKFATHEDLVWAAGFLQGEGCFSRYNQSDRVTATQRDWEPIARLLHLFGGQARTQFTRGTAYAVWYVNGARARGVMMTLYLLVGSIKQANIRRVLLDELVGVAA